jgi:hypothetical protein
MIPFLFYSFKKLLEEAFSFLFFQLRHFKIHNIPTAHQTFLNWHLYIYINPFLYIFLCIILCLVYCVRVICLQLGQPPFLHLATLKVPLKYASIRQPYLPLPMKQRFLQLSRAQLPPRDIGLFL